MEPDPNIEDPLERLLTLHVEGQLDEAGQQELAGLLERDEAARDQYVKYMAVHGWLEWDGAQADTRASIASFLSRASSNAYAYVRREPVISALAATVVIGGLIGVLAVLRLTGPQPGTPARPPAYAPAYVAKLTGQLDPVWKGEAPLGDMPRFTAGRKLELKSGLAEITYDVGTRVILEGPCEYTIDGSNSGSLKVGDLTARVPAGAEGYMVGTPTAVITDLGTEFAISVARSGETTAFVAEGVVELLAKDSAQSPVPRKLTAGGGLRVTADGRVEQLGPETAAIAEKTEKLPKQLPRIVRPLVNGGFEHVTVTRGSFPRQPGKWRGEAAKIVGVDQGIAPYEGTWMYRYIYANPTGPGKTAGAELRQAIDLRPYADAVKEGRLHARLKVRFNRVAGDAQTDTQFRAFLFAHNKPLTGTAADHKKRPGFTNIGWQKIDTDGDPATWESLTVAGTPPSGTQFLVVQLHAGENVYNDLKGTEFDGHYVDAVQLRITIDPPAGDGEIDEPVKK